MPTSIGEANGSGGGGLRIAAWPNPSSGSVAFTLEAREPGPARLALHGPDGRRLAVLWEGPLASGGHRLVWDGRGAAGRDLGPGLYFARLESAEGTEVLKILRVR